jgi:hypothetical protein
VCNVGKGIYNTLKIERLRKAEGIPRAEPPAESVELPARILRPTDAVAAGSQAIRERGPICNSLKIERGAGIEQSV